MYHSLHLRYSISYLIIFLCSVLQVSARRVSISLTDLTESVKSPKKIAMNVPEKDTTMLFNVWNQSNIIHSISDNIWRGLCNSWHNFVKEIWLILVNNYLFMHLLLIIGQLPLSQLDLVLYYWPSQPLAWLVSISDCRTKSQSTKVQSYKSTKVQKWNWALKLNGSLYG